MYIFVYFSGVGTGLLSHNETSRSQILKSIFKTLPLGPKLGRRYSGKKSAVC